MFGIFYLLYNGIMTVVAKTVKGYEYTKDRSEARNRGDLTYYGHNGERLVSNNKTVYRKIVDGDHVLADLYTGQIYKNFDAEKREARNAKLITQGKTVIPMHYEEHQEYLRKSRWTGKSSLLNPEYKDIKTGRYYIRVFLNGLSFYMDFQTGKLIRLTDGCDESKKWGILTVKEIMDIFNKRQMELYKIPTDEHDSWWWEKHFYLKKDIYNILFIDDNKEIIYGDCFDEKIKKIRHKLIEEGRKNNE